MLCVWSTSVAFVELADSAYVDMLCVCGAYPINLERETAGSHQMGGSKETEIRARGRESSDSLNGIN